MTAIPSPHPSIITKDFLASLERSKDVFLVLDAKRYIEFVNDAWEKLTGFKKSEMHGQSIEEQLHPDDREANLQKIYAVANGDAPFATISARLRYAGDGYVDTQIIVHRVQAHTGGIALLAMIVQSSASVAAQESPREEWLDASADILYKMDVDARFTYMNQTGLHTFGYAHSDLRHVTLGTLVLQDDFERVTQFFHRQFEQRVMHTYLEFRMVTRWGEWIWVGQNTNLVLDGDTPTGLFCIARDITVQKRAEDELLTSERRYWLAFETALHGIYFADRKGLIRYINPAMTRLTGFHRDELLGYTFLKYLEPSLKDAYARQFYELIASHAPMQGEYLIISREGKHIFTEMQMYVIDIDGEPLVVTHVKDVTEQRLREHATLTERDSDRMRLETLEEINRLKTRVLSAVSHEFRTPLASIIGFTSTILDTPDMEPASVQKYLKVVLQQGRRLNGLVDEMLDLSLLESRRMILRIKEYDLVELVSEIIDSLQSSAAKRQITFTLRRPQSPVLCRGDQNRMEQAIHHVIDNAVKYSFEKHEILVAIEQRNAAAVVTVTNRGMGIRTDEADRVFDAFFRSVAVSETIAGTGLGLTIAKEILEAHRGTIRIESIPQETTVVTMTFPIQFEPAGQSV